MTRLFKRVVLGFLAGAFLFIALPVASSQAGSCTGRFINPITDVCWDCLFPFTIGNIPIIGGKGVDTPNPSLPLCLCGTPIPRLGIAIGFWEPFRAVDVTYNPWCFVNLGGLNLDPGFDAAHGKHPTGPESDTAAWQAHWYMYPLIGWLNILIDFACLELSVFDVAYITELDPLWMDDELTAIINPEGFLFANVIAQAACALDCTTSSLGLPLDPLFWCAGCQGGMYPMNGHVQAHIGDIQSSQLVVERMTFKLHRQLQLWGSIGDAGLCGLYPMPVMRKSQYRSQLVNPVPNVSGPFACNPYGRSTVFWETMKSVPVVGEDYGYLIWRKRNCCLL